MSEPGAEAAAGSPEFSELWRKISEDDRGKRQARRGTQQTLATATSPGCKDLRSPRLRGSSRFLGSNVTESPGDVEASQDIFWDGTSPTHTGQGYKNTRAVKISDIVNRIAPKNIKPKVTESSLLHWIDDGTIPCTPDVPKHRVRKRSSRQSSVEDLMKLAKQFDKNMQQDEESSVQQNTVTGKLCDTADVSENNVKEPRCPSLSEQAEAELRALFDSSTQGISGRLSEGSVPSQDRQDLLETCAFIDQRQSEPKPSDKHSTNNLVDFEDDWDNDDLLNDSLILALTQDPSNPPKTIAKSHTNTTELASALQSTSNKKLENPSKRSFGLLQDLCPKTKTRNRSTFKLESNPHFQTMLDKEVAKSGSTALQPKSKSTEEKPATMKTDSDPQCEKVTNGVKFFRQASSVKDVSDSLWDDGDDDALLYQVCDSVERVSNSQPDEASLKICEGQKSKGPVDRRQNMRDRHANAESSGSSGVGANRRSSGSFVRSHSLPLTSCKTGNYQGWNIPLKGGNNKSGISQSFPASQVGPGGNFSHGNMATKPHPAMTRVAQNSMSQHAAFKRNVSDSAIINNKVFVTSQTAGKCSAAEIERKKQEALARRRLRMQNASKP
ncbi:ewing's tumor-associated antigen 1 homolog isoform X1 [Gambusia affinis]|uniref:ewing's tumor-associated antigen 1 homolog isoform X1 n=1 Tax=Gambusia affinis TaxID=33528 RepID=UPI001CDC7C08|nr:ewing's tumor-associated antigen 1 homolog isoform X1 [Gambusia affinis]